MRYILALMLAAFLVSPANAAFQGPGGVQGGYGGFQGPGTGVPATTVQQAKGMWDDSIVTLTGNIVAKITGTKDKYLFRDKTGEIRVEIDDEYFYGVNVTPANTVRITGEVDKDFGRATEIDVKRLEVLN